ncbi:MAG: hypothetical protein ABMA64_31030 [Myxococcota bacterium]
MRGWLAWGAVVVVGCGGPERRAATALERFEAGDAERLTMAIEAADAAVERHPDDPAAWALRGEVHLAWAERPPVSADLPARDPAAAALESFDKASGLGAAGGVHGALTDRVPALEALLVARLVNATEAGAWDEAAEVLAVALRARALDEQLRGAHPDRAATLERLAVQVDAARADSGGALAHYQAFARANGADEPALALLVTRALVAADRADDALGFVGPLSAAFGDDQGLLRAEVELLVAAGRGPDAIARIEGALPASRTTAGDHLLAGALLGVAGAPTMALARFEEAVKLAPSDVSARVALGSALTAAAVDARAEIDARDQELDQRRPPRDLLQRLAELPGLWLRAESELVAATAADPTSCPAAQALVALYMARIGDLDEETATEAERAMVRGDMERRAAAERAAQQNGCGTGGAR